MNMQSCAQGQLHTFGEDQSRAFALDQANRCLSQRSAEQRVAWALENLPAVHVLSSSFGAQSAVMLHMLNAQAPRIPVILVDTGYLFPETYRFVHTLTDRLDLNLQVFQPRSSAAWQEARYGRRWEQGATGIDAYNRDNKVEPMERALAGLKASTWFAGLRSAQAGSRRKLEILAGAGERWKVHPIIDWNDRDVYAYLQRHDLPYHPLWDEGYVSIGDVHTTRSLNDVDDVGQTRFFGLRRECGIHEIAFSGDESQAQ